MGISSSALSGFAQSYLANKQRQQQSGQELQNLIIKSIIEQQIKMQDPYYKLQALMLAKYMPDLLGREEASAMSQPNINFGGINRATNQPINRVQQYRMKPTFTFGKEGLNIGLSQEETPEYKMEISTKELTAEQKNAIQATKNSLTIINDIEKKLSQKNPTGQYSFPTGGKIPSFRYSTLPGAGYIMARRGKPGELALNAQLRKLQAEFIKAQTGAQRGFKEMSFLLPALPMIDVQDNKQALEVLMGAKQDMLNYLNQMQSSSKQSSNLNQNINYQDNQAVSPYVSQYREGQTAINLKTGQRLIYRGGKWQIRTK